MLAMVFADKFVGMSNVSDRFPGAICRRVTLPVDKVLELVAIDLGVKDLLNLLFFVAVDDFRRRHRRLDPAGNGIGFVAREQEYVEYQMDLHLSWEFELVCRLGFADYF